MSSIIKGPTTLLNILGHAPRVTLAVLPTTKKKKRFISKKLKTVDNHNTVEAHQVAKSPLYTSRYKFHRPYYLQFHSSDFNHEILQRQHFKPLCMRQLQQLIDTNRIDTDQPIDMSTLCLTGFFQLSPELMEGGFMLKDENVDVFKTKINIEVQHCSEASIAAIERNGGTVTAAYYDPYSISALQNPEKFFQTGMPIPKRMMPPQKSIKMYMSAKNRGYLANPDAIAEERYLLSQKYGYVLPDIKQDSDYDMLIQRKDPRQIFFGLQPGWIVNLTDKVIIKPKDQELLDYYNS